MLFLYYFHKGFVTINNSSIFVKMHKQNKQQNKYYGIFKITDKQGVLGDNLTWNNTLHITVFSGNNRS